MKFFRHHTPQRRLTIYPFVCWHVGALQSDDKFIRQMIARVKDDPEARWVYMGDGGECVTKQSKGDVYTQTLNIQEQLEYLVELLEPIAPKGLFGVRGNHGNRVFKETGMGFDDNLCRILRLPYMGLSCFAKIIVNRSGYDVFFHHGIDSGVTVGAKTTAAKKLEQNVWAYAIFAAHSHICCELPPSHSAYIEAHRKNAGADIRWRTTASYICGCAYDSRSGYAEDKGYPPILPAHLAVTFGGVCRVGTPVHEQTCTIWRAEA